MGEVELLNGKTVRRHRRGAGEGLVSIKVRPETKRLLDLIVIAEGTTLVDLEAELARERWEKVKSGNILP